ncbi:MAG: nitronate monooxygenase [Gammaproteobacteria bacterium]
MTSLNTPLCDLLGCEYPIIQTAMGWIADPKLVAGTCNAGGFGFLAGATIPPDQLEVEILKTRELTVKPFGMNFHMYQPNAADIVKLVIKHGIRAVSYSRSPGPELIKCLKDAGVVCMPTVGLLKHAIRAVELGADAVTVQGGEGGGHTGPVPTTLLLPQVVDVVDVPVAAAGGFKDGRGLVAALAFGAAGIAMGTRFLMTAESPVPPETLARYQTEKDPSNIIISRQVDGMPQRMIMNELLTDLEKKSGPGLLLTAIKNGLSYRKFTGASAFDLLKSAMAMRSKDSLSVAQIMMSANAPMMIQKAMVEGRPAEGILPSGQVAAMIDDLPTCEELIHRIIAQARETLTALQ